MEWKDQSTKHLDLIREQLHEVQLSLRFNKQSDAYKMSEIILNRLNNNSILAYYHSLFMVYMWGTKYLAYIDEMTVFNKTLLMYNRVRKQLKKTKQRLSVLV